MNMRVSTGFVTSVFVLYLLCAGAKGMGQSGKVWNLKKHSACIDDPDHQHCKSCNTANDTCPPNPCINGDHRYFAGSNKNHWCECWDSWAGVYCNESTMTSTTKSTTRETTTKIASTAKSATTQPPSTTPKQATTASPSTRAKQATTESSSVTTKQATTESPSVTTKQATTESHSVTTKQATTEPPSTTTTKQATIESQATTKQATTESQATTTKATTESPSTTTNKATTESQATTTKQTTTESQATTESPSTTSNQQTTQSSIVRSVKHCPGQVKRNINWPPTDYGAVSIRPCPNGAIGTGQWTCGKAGTWEGDPDLSNCISSWLLNITETRDPAEDILSNIADHLEREDNIYGGDVNETIRLLGSLVERQERQLNNISRVEEANDVVTNFSNTMIRTVNALLLNNVTGAAWSDIPRERRSAVASGIMDSTDKTGILFARTVPNKTLSIATDNVMMNIGTTSGGGSKFPDLTNVSASSGWENVTDEITLPESQHPVVSVLYNSLGEHLQPDPEKRTVNSRIISATLVNRSSSDDVKVDGNVTIFLKHTETSNISSCFFWNITEGDWSDKGCTKKNTSDTQQTVCVCNHLTSFAILVDVTGQEHPFALSVITYIGCIISIVCLFFCICVFLGFRRVRCTRTIIHANLCICLLVAEVVFLAAVGKTENAVVCDAIAILLHYLFLAVFTWMCVEGVELYVLLVKVFNLKMNRLIYYHLVGYGAPALAVAISVTYNYFVDVNEKDKPDEKDDDDDGYFDGYGTDTYCWLSVNSYFIWSFVGPMLIVVLVNVGFLAMTMRVIYTQKAHDRSNQSEQGMEFKFWIRVSLALVCILGLTWVFGVLYISSETLVFAYVFTVINSLQGLFIFIFHCLLNEMVQDEIERRFGVRCPCWSKKKRQKTVKRQSRRTARAPQQQEIWLGDFTDTKDSHSSTHGSLQTNMSSEDTLDKLDDEGFVENSIYEDGAGTEGSVDNVIYEAGGPA